MCALSITAAAIVAALSAQNPNNSPLRVRVERTTEHIRVDGRLDDAAWSSAEPVRVFTQVEPDEGHAASERMEVRVLLGDDALYVGARMFDREIASAGHRLARRDDDTPADVFAIALDPQHDRLHGVRFQVSSAGTVSDALVGPTGTLDPSWDPVWEARTSIDSLGWTAELRIPLSQLRVDRSRAEWGIQLERFLLRRLERSYAAYTDKASLPSGVMTPAYYGTLIGLANAPAARGVDLLPYMSMSGSYVHDDVAGPALRSPRGVYDRRVGLDARATLHGQFTMSATVNPDFGQVEVDPAVVNLSAFETIFPEHRPFFVEASDRFAFGEMRDWYSTQSPTLFYSRRIGRPPHGSAFGDTGVVYADVPGQTDILGAAKVVGRTSGGWSIATLDAVTGRANARTLSTSGALGSVAVEPLTNYFVGRTTRDFRDGETTIGGIVTSVARSLDLPALAGVVPARATVGGIDLNQSWAHHAWALDASVARSDVRGTASAIAALQRSSARYFQRPDDRHDRFDPSLTALEGYDTQLALSRLTGKWVGSVVWQDVSPGFEANDIGRLRDAGRRALSLDLHLQDFTPGAHFQRFIIWPFAQSVWNYDGQQVGNSYNLFVFGEWRNHWQTGVEYDYYPSVYDDRLTRGGPVARAPASHHYYYRIASPARDRASFFSTANAIWTEAGGRSINLRDGVTWQARSNLKLELDPTVSIVRDPAQFVASYADSTATATFGRRTVFATLDQRTLGLDARTDWIISPRLSIQAYAQELIVASPFTDYKMLSAPGTYAFAHYGVDRGSIDVTRPGIIALDADAAGPGPRLDLADPDFTVRTSRLNAVLRWEFRAGSSLYVVWQHERGGTTTVGPLVLHRDLVGLIGGRPDNVVAVKATFWIGR